MKKLYFYTALVALTSAPYALHADEPPPKKQLILPLLNDGKTKKNLSEPAQRPTPGESMGDYCDHQSLSS